MACFMAILCIHSSRQVLSILDLVDLHTETHGTPASSILPVADRELIHVLLHKCNYFMLIILVGEWLTLIFINAMQCLPSKSMPHLLFKSVMSKYS